MSGPNAEGASFGAPDDFPRAGGLFELAEFFATHPEIPTPKAVIVHAFVYDRPGVVEAVAAEVGPDAERFASATAADGLTVRNLLPDSGLDITYHLFEYNDRGPSQP